MKPHFILLLTALALCVPAFAQDIPAREDIRIIVVTHGSAADPFWSVVINGVNDAATDMGVSVEYRAPDTFDMVEMSLMIDAAIAADPHGLVVTIADPDALEGPIRDAVAEGIPIISINTGADVSSDFGALLHVGQEEYIAGQGGGERMAEAGVTRAVCINHEVGNVALDQRCEGFADGLGEGAEVEVLGVAGDFDEIRSSVEIFLTQHEDIEGVLTLGPVGAHPTLAALANMDMTGELMFGTFDLSPEILEALDADEMSFAIDQQQYLQGYLPIVLLTNYITYGLMPGADVLTGPGFVTPDEAALVIELSERGIR